MIKVFKNTNKTDTNTHTYIYSYKKEGERMEKDGTKDGKRLGMRRTRWGNAPQVAAEAGGRAGREVGLGAGGQAAAPLCGGGWHFGCCARRLGGVLGLETPAMEPLVSKRSEWWGWQCEPAGLLLVMIVLVASCLVVDHLRALRPVDWKQMGFLAIAAVALTFQASSFESLSHDYRGD